MKSVIQQDPTYCYWCGRSDEPLDCHHVFFGPLRKTSEKYGLTVYLCHDRCHIFGPNAVHNNREVDLRIKRDVQRKAMQHYGWGFREWMDIIGKNYL